MAIIGLSDVARWELTFIAGRLDCCKDVTAEIIHGKRTYGLMLYGDLVETVNKEVFDAIDQLPKHGNLLLFAITAVYNPLLPIITRNPNARIPRSLGEFVNELTYPLFQRAWYIVYDEYLPDR